VDTEQLECDLPPVPPLCDHMTCDGCWKGYPQSRFPNWTHRQVVKSKIHKAITEYSHEQPCVHHRVDVDMNGFFTNAGPIEAHHGNERVTWERLISETVSRHAMSRSSTLVHTNTNFLANPSQRPANIRLRALFVENMSGPALQMLGAR